MFGYVRPHKQELLVREFEQYKGAYCQLCRQLGKDYGWTARLTLSYDCTFYALLACPGRTARSGCAGAGAWSTPSRPVNS